MNDERQMKKMKPGLQIPLEWSEAVLCEWSLRSR